MKLSLLFVLLFAGNFVMAQGSVLTGKIIDESSKEPIDFATVTFKNSIDSIQIRGCKSDQNGDFKIENLPAGTYTISISSIGYTTRVLKNYPVNLPTHTLGTLTISSSSKTLKNVTISGEKEGIALGIDKKTFNVDKNITAAGGTAADILRNVPSVNVDMDGNLSLRGKDNVTLLVDGKPSAMFGNDAATALQTIPASSIESIEVITNPSSKYEAQGMNGIINIILRKDRKEGYNLLLNAGIAEPFRINGGINLNVNIKKWNIFLNANGRTSKTWEKTISTRDNYENEFTYSSNTFNRRRPLSGFANFGFDYSINSKNKITFSQNIFNANMRGASNNIIENELNYQTPVSSQVRSNQYTGKPLSATTNLQYKHTFKDAKEDLNIELNFSKSRYLRTSDFKTNVYDSSNNLVNSFEQKNPIEGGNTNFTFQTDYTKPLGKSGKLDFGERTYLIQFKSENQPTIQYQNQVETEEVLLKNHFLFSQQVHGVYGNISNQFNKTGIQVGLRAEYFAYNATVYQYNASSSDGYFSLFPTLFVSQKIAKHDDLNFNYARRVNRPNFYQLIPYLDVSNPQDTSQGNPDLKPEFIHAMELTYTHQHPRQGTFIVSAYYQFTNNLIQRFRRFNADGTTYSQNRNLATGKTYGLELTAKMNLLKWWDATANINLFRNHIDGTNIDAATNRTGYGAFAKLTSNAKLDYGFSTQLTANYFATTVVAQGEVKPYGNVDFAIKKTLLNNLISLTLNVNDIFNTIQTQTIYNLYPYYNQSLLRKNQTRSIGLNVQVRLASKSQLKASEAPRRNTSGKKEKEAKSRDENLKKDEGGGEEGGGGNR